METNLEKAKRLITADANIKDICLKEDNFFFQMLELASTPNKDDLIISKHKAETIANAIRLTANIYGCRTKKGKTVDDGNGRKIGAETAWDREVVLAEKYIKLVIEKE